MLVLIMVLPVPACRGAVEDPKPALVSQEPMVTYHTGTDALWYITIDITKKTTVDGTNVDGIASGSAERCVQDPMVAERLPSPDASSAAFTVILPPHAIEDDAQRIVSCFQQELPETPLTLTRPANPPRQG
ncbi:hypothetical protein V6S67_19485 [Arthrobacter sp. Soc17.1.1.1]|uniref:hypothetical protein n=1 Tax=Arthrobacter sp. Soc17.1.1.1 TaxID=3121277 RepID=UPI002FE4A477